MKERITKELHSIMIECAHNQWYDAAAGLQKIISEIEKKIQEEKHLQKLKNDN